MRFARAVLCGRAVLLALLVAAPLSAQGAPGGQVYLRTGLAAGGLCGVALVPGVEAVSGGSVHFLASVDAYLPVGDPSSDCGGDPSGDGRIEVARTSLSPPRLRVGMGWDVPGGWSSAALRGFVGQQGVVEGFQPLAGAGAVLGSGRWGVGLDASVHRGTVYARSGNPEIPGIIEEEAVRRAWVPRLELYGRVDPGSALSGTVRPALGGVAAGLVGGFAGGLAGAALADCGGSGCAAAFFVGAAAGETLALPLGVHLAEGRRGSYLLTTLASVGVTAAGVALAVALGDHGATGQGIAVLVPLGQLAATIAVERRAR